MGDMVRRVAMAINPDAFDVDYQKRYLFKAWQDQAKLIAYREARAAIEAMRSPNHDMTASVVGVGQDRSAVVGIYQSMIDAALK